MPVIHHISHGHSAGQALGGSQGGGNNDGGGYRIKGGQIIPIPPWQPFVGFAGVSAGN